MASLNTIYLKIETLEELARVVRAKGEKGLELTISISDNLNVFGKNVAGWVSQSKEQIKEKKPKYYVGNGKTYWSTNDDHPKIAQDGEVKGASEDLPF